MSDRKLARPLRLVFLLVFAAAFLNAAQIQYDLTGTLQWNSTSGADTPGFDGQSFVLNVLLSDLTPTPVSDPNVAERNDYVGFGALTIGGFNPTIDHIDIIIVNANPGFGDFSQFAVRTADRDYLFTVFFGQSANDVTAPPPIYPAGSLVGAGMQIPMPLPQDNILYSVTNAQLDSSAVPEPLSLMLVGVGLLAVSLRAFRRV